MLAQAAPPATSGVIFVGVVIAVVAVATLGMLILRFGGAIGSSNQLARERKQRAGVKRSLGEPYKVMSRPLVGYVPDRRIDNSVSTTGNAGQSGGNRQPALTDNEAAAEDVNDQGDISTAQKDLQYQYHLEALAILVNAGVASQAEGIERLFGVTRSGRKDSRYAQIRADLLPLLKKDEAATPIAGRPTAATFASDREPA